MRRSRLAMKSAKGFVVDRKIFDYYVANGGNFFDSANVYSSGRSWKLLENSFQ